MEESSAYAGGRWKSHRFAGFLVRLVAFAAPLLVGLLVARQVGSFLPSPEGVLQIVGWWTAVVTSAAVASHFADRISRKLLPLSVLLNLSLAFPDKTPSRFGVALRSGNVTFLRNRLDAATEAGETDLAEATAAILGLVGAISKHDRKTRGHAERTRAYSDLLAEQLGLATLDRDKLRWASLLHDIGKLTVPAEILNKPEKLTKDEFEIIKQHPREGMKLIAPIEGWLGPWAVTIEHHHERWDGTGYPAGLTGTEISYGARIVAVADAYDVMVSGRSYQERMSHQEAREEVARHSGTQFDPKVARALMELSLGKLRWITGPLAGLADLPLIRPLQSLSRDVATVAAAGAITIAAGSGIIPLGSLALDGPLLGPPVDRPAVENELGTEGTLAAPGPNNGSGPDGASGTTAAADTTTTSAGPDSPTTTNVAPSDTTPGSTAPTTTAPPGTTTTTIPPTTTTSAAPTTTTTLPPTTTTTSPGVIANDDQASTRPSDKVNIQVLSNDSGYSAGTLQVTSAPSAGTAEVFGGGKIRYTAPANFNGVVTFTYQVCSPSGGCATATVTVTVS